MIESIRSRSTKSQLLLFLSLTASLAMLFFSIYRASVSQWPVAFLDFVIFVGMAIIFGYVYKTNNVKQVSLIIILLALSGNIVSFYFNGISQVGWVYPSMLFAFYLMTPKRGLYVNFTMLMFYIPKLVTTLSTIDLVTLLSTIFLTNVIAFVFASGLTNQAKALTRLASVDYLTQTGNRRALNHHLQKLHKALKNHDKTACLMLLDLDHFKKINDTHGHIKGDEVLRALSKIMLRHFDAHGKVYRYGGEEFMLVCADIDLEQGSDLADQLRSQVKKKIIISNKALTVSIGIAEYRKEESIDEWIHRVDLALYRAKKEGRDRLIKA